MKAVDTAPADRLTSGLWKRMARVVTATGTISLGILLTVVLVLLVRQLAA